MLHKAMFFGDIDHAVHQFGFKFSFNLCKIIAENKGNSIVVSEVELLLDIARRKGSKQFFNKNLLIFEEPSKCKAVFGGKTHFDYNLIQSKI